MGSVFMEPLNHAIAPLLKLFCKRHVASKSFLGLSCMEVSNPMPFLAVARIEFLQK